MWHLPDWEPTCDATQADFTISDGDLDDTGGGLFYFDGDQSRIHIWNNTGADLFVHPRVSTYASPVHCIHDDGSLTLTDKMYQLSLSGAASQDQGTHYDVYGWE